MPGTFWQSKGLRWIRKPSSIVDVMDTECYIRILKQPELFQGGSLRRMPRTYAQSSRRRGIAAYNATEHD